MNIKFEELILSFIKESNSIQDFISSKSLRLQCPLTSHNFLENKNFINENRINWVNLYSLEIGNIVASYLRKEKRLNLKNWEPNNIYYPRFMLLGPDKGILAYCEFFYHENEDITDTQFIHNGIFHLFEDLKLKLTLVDSDLDRPVFYIHIVDYKNQKGIFFETAEMIKNNILENIKVGFTKDNFNFYNSNVSEMGDFNELINIFTDLKKNNVKIY